MVLCLVALVVFSIMSAGSAKYKTWARDALRCVIKNLTLSPCDVGLEQRIKGKITAKLLVVPSLARFFYRHFNVISWLFTITFFASLIYTVYSFYNFFVYGSCEPSGVCYITWIGWCILLIEKALIYIVILILAVIAAYFIIRRLRRKSP
jgi:ABC-type multidrug transport system permease subunit